MKLSVAKRTFLHGIGHIGSEPTHNEIDGRAYAPYAPGEKQEGNDWNHWFNAEGIIENNFGYGGNHTEHDFMKDDEMIEV